MMSEVTPQGYENMFFGLFGITNRAVSDHLNVLLNEIFLYISLKHLIPFMQSSVIGPNVVQAIINSTNNSWLGFPFLFAICTIASIIIWMVDVEKGRQDCKEFVERKNRLNVTEGRDRNNL